MMRRNIVCGVQYLCGRFSLNSAIMQSKEADLLQVLPGNLMGVEKWKLS